MATISIANNRVQHNRTKHVEIDRHFIKERLDNGSICILTFPPVNRLLTFSPKGFANKTLVPMLASWVLLIFMSQLEREC